MIVGHGVCRRDENVLRVINELPPPAVVVSVDFVTHDLARSFTALLQQTDANFVGTEIARNAVGKQRPPDEVRCIAICGTYRA